MSLNNEKILGNCYGTKKEKKLGEKSEAMHVPLAVSVQPASVYPPLISQSLLRQAVLILLADLLPCLADQLRITRRGSA